MKQRDIAALYGIGQSTVEKHLIEGIGYSTIPEARRPDIVRTRPWLIASGDHLASAASARRAERLQRLRPGRKHMSWFLAVSS
jgi:hypothetical protein